MSQQRVTNRLDWQPPAEVFTAPMYPVRPWPVRLDRFNKGIDNVHVDVLVSPHFVSRMTRLVREMVRQDLCINYWGEADCVLSSDLVRVCRESYRGLMEVGLDKVRQNPTADSVRLMQLSLLKFMLLLVPQEIQRLKRRLEATRDDLNARSIGRGMELHDRVVVLVREERAVTYRVFQKLFRLIEKLESNLLRRVRKSVIGVSWPIPRDILFNPLLLLPDLWSEEQVILHYPPMCLGQEQGDCLEKANACVTRVFKPYLPAWIFAEGDDATRDSDLGADSGQIRIRPRQDQGVLKGFFETEMTLCRLLTEEEYKTPRYSWLDEPTNLEMFIRSGNARSRPDSVSKRERAAASNSGWASPQWPEFQRRVMAELHRCLEREQMTGRVVASYWTRRLHYTLAGAVPVPLIFGYLVGQLPRRRLHRSLTALQSVSDPGSVLKTLDMAVAEMRRLPQSRRRRFVNRFLVDCMRLRRDLKLAYKTYQCMDRIRLLQDPDEINLSRTNGLLHQYLLREELEQETRPIRNHVILKADVRGSTGITSELRTRRLNPASHFSLNFFNPINKLLDDFGASKVFLEGDAVILSIFEYEGEAYRWLSVAQACGLARKILGVVNRQNVSNQRYGLPPLELGIGITFCDDEPTFLYDGDRKIMITPAINVADRLSSCTAELRQKLPGASTRFYRLEVFHEPGEASSSSNADGRLLRYNVNGIELEAAAFQKLRQELVMREVKIRGPDLEVQERFYLGRYPDRRGKMHWLVVRDAPVRLWNGLRTTDPEPNGRRFYEVIADSELFLKLKEKLRPSAPTKAGRSHT